MFASEDSVPDEALPERQRQFLERLRRHDKRVQVIRSGDQLKFHGPVIGDGTLPPAEPAGHEPDEADDEP
jgi:hypothetical protein